MKWKSGLVGLLSVALFFSVAADEIKAVQLDLARQMETVSFVKAFTDKVAEAGYNTLVLYLEGRVRTASFSLGEQESYSLEEMREIVDHASKHGIEVVPVVSILGHAEHFFSRPDLGALSEERHGICRWPVAKKETFCLNQSEAKAFLERYLAEVATAFPGRYFHVGLDESFQFGFCDTCRARREEIGFGPLFTEYVKWADGVCKRLGKRMWMWDDMFEFFPEELVNVPKDVVMCLWIYDNDVTEWGHRGHFLNRIRRDWLAEYEKLGLESLPVSAACLDNIRTLASYAARHRTLGTYVSQWELRDSFYGVPMPILIGVDRAFPTLGPVERAAVESLMSTWAYFRSNGGVEISRSRRRGRISADVSLNASEPAAVRLALEVLKGAKSHPGDGNVSAAPLSEEALLDDLVTQFEQFLFTYELDAISVALSTPRRTADESKATKDKLRRLVPKMKRVLSRREVQERTWRPNMVPKDLTEPMRDSLDYVEKLLAVQDVATVDEWILGVSLSLPDFHGIPKWRVSGLFADGWREIASGCWKPARGNWANFELNLAFKSSEAPSLLRVEECGYGEGLLLHVSVWNRSRRLVPGKIVETSGAVVDPANILKDDWRPVRFGLQDRSAIFLNPSLAEIKSSLTCTLIDSACTCKVDGLGKCTSSSAEEPSFTKAK